MTEALKEEAESEWWGALGGPGEIFLYNSLANYVAYGLLLPVARY